MNYLRTQYDWTRTDYDHFYHILLNSLVVGPEMNQFYIMENQWVIHKIIQNAMRCSVKDEFQIFFYFLHGLITKNCDDNLRKELIIKSDIQ